MALRKVSQKRHVANIDRRIQALQYHGLVRRLNADLYTRQIVGQMQKAPPALY